MENGWYPRRRKSPVTLLQEVRESTPVQTRHNVVRWACALESWEVGGGGAAASGATSCQGRWMKPRGWRDQAELEGGLVQLIGTRTRVLRLKKSISPWYSSSSLGYLVHSLSNCVMTLPTETSLRDVFIRSLYPPPPLNLWTMSVRYSRHFLLPVCIRAYAVGAADDRKEPSGDWSLNNLSQSKPGIPSKLRSRAVGTEYSTSLGILQVR